MSSTIKILPEPTHTIHKFGDIQAAMQEIYYQHRKKFEMAGLDNHFHPVIVKSKNKVVKADMKAELSSQDYIWWMSNVSPRAVNLRISDFPPLRKELEEYRQQTNISVCYDIDLFAGRIPANKYLWYLVSSAIGCLANGVADLSDVYEFAHEDIVKANTLVNIFFGD